MRVEGRIRVEGRLTLGSLDRVEEFVLLRCDDLAWALGFRDFEFSAQGFGFGVSGLGCQVSGFGFRVSGIGFRVEGVGLTVYGLGFRVWGIA